MPGRLTAALQSLADRPARLFAVLVLANAVGLPYGGMVHDARLYAIQALDAWDGRYADDLFFRYGSQAKFTLFPKLLAPVYATFGPDLPCWVGYLAAAGAYLVAVQRFLFALLGRTPAAVVAAVVLAATPVPVGGTGLLLVNESFFTPRPLAVALSLLAFERLLAGRAGQAGLFVAAAGALHPLVAAPAVAIWGLWVLRTATGRSPGAVAAAAVGLGLAGGALLVAAPDLGVRAFGHFDPEWKRWVLRLHTYTDPGNWGTGDWFRLAQGLGFAAGTVVVWRGDRDRRGLAVFAALLAVVGVAVAWAAVHAEFALLFQGQAYRWVWPLELLRYPLGIALAARLWAAGTPRPRVAAVVVVGLLAGLPWMDARVYPLAGLVGAVGVVLWRGLGKDPLRPDWAVPAAAAGVAAGVVLWEVGSVVVPLRALCSGSRWDQTLDLGERVTVWTSIPGPAVRLLLVLAAVWPALRGPKWLAVGGPLLAGLGVHVLTFTLPRTEWAERAFVPDRADARFVRDYLARWAGPPRPTVYWPAGRVEAVWLWIDCPCFFDTFQLSGNAFHRGTAAEGHRRAVLTRAFEVDRARAAESGFWKQQLSGTTDNLFEAAWDHPPPTADDLARLAADPGVEVIVLPNEFPGAAATNGRVFIYEARKLGPR